MSSSLLWLPPRKYDSVRPIWQDQYIWCPLPVDNTIPLHQTSFIDISEGDAKAARSRASTLRSRASTGSITHVRDRSGSLKSVAEAQAWANDGEVSRGQTGGISAESSPRNATETISAKKGLRPGPPDSKRLRSFHLPARLNPETKPTIEKAMPVDTRNVPSQPLQEIIVIDNETTLNGDNKDPFKEYALPVKQYTSDSGHARGSPPRKARRRSRRVSSERVDHEAKNKAADRRQSLHRFPNERLNLKPSNQTGRSKQMSLQLNLNLDVEVQLKVTLHGELTLSLFN